MHRHFMQLAAEHRLFDLNLLYHVKGHPASSQEENTMQLCMLQPAFFEGYLAEALLQA